MLEGVAKSIYGTKEAEEGIAQSAEILGLRFPEMCNASCIVT